MSPERRKGLLLAGLAVGSVVVVVVGSGALGGSGSRRPVAIPAATTTSTTVAVAGVTVTAVVAPPVRPRDQSFEDAFRAATPTGPVLVISSTTTPTTRVSPVTIAPGVDPATATASAPGLNLFLVADPVAGGGRTVALGLTARFGSPRVLLSAAVDYGDGTRRAVPVAPPDCSAPAAPAGEVLTPPSHTYVQAGTYEVVVAVETGTCSPEDDDPGLPEPAQVRVRLTVR